MKHRLVAALVLSACVLPIGHVTAQQPTVIELRIATLTPRGGAGAEAFDRFDRILRERTGGRVRIRLFAGGSAGDEALVVRKIRSGQLDGAIVSTTGLGLVVRPVLVLAAPGLLPTYAKLDAVRTQLAPEWDAQFEAAGLKLMGWGDAGRTRLFSVEPVRTPSDLRRMRPWVWPDNPVFVEFIQQTGATGVPLGVPEVMGALQTRMVDVVTASALTAVGLQWHARVRHMSQQSSSAIVGASVLSKAKWDSLPPDLQQVFRDLSRENAGRTQQLVRAADERAYETLVSRGVQPVDLQPARAAWEDVQRRTRERLVGRLYPRDLLERVERIAASVPN